jgi:hypothetical protein
MALLMGIGGIVEGDSGIPGFGELGSREVI